MAAMIIILMMAGCASPATWSRHELCFGLSADSGRTTFTQHEWQQFVDQEIAPRFPDGFTVVQAEGFWRSGEVTVTEPSRILMVVAPDNQETQKTLDAIANAYVQRFRQESVLQIKTPAHVAFHH
jgi:hypothetical protein